MIEIRRFIGFVSVFQSMPMNAPTAEFVTSEGVTFRVVEENSSNHKTPSHPARLDRYNGEDWKEVDRWDIRDYEKEEEHSNNRIYTKSDDEIVQEAKRRINEKAMFQNDGQVVDIARR